MMKWVTNGVQFRRGCYEGLIARYDGKGPWYTPRAMMTQQTMKAEFRHLGNHFGSQTCEVKPLYDEDDRLTETDITEFDIRTHDDLTDPTKWEWKFTQAEIHP